MRAVTYRHNLGMAWMMAKFRDPLGNPLYSLFADRPRNTPRYLEDWHSLSW